MADTDASTLVVMSGIPFAGKTTLARELAARCGLTRVSVDEIVVELAIELGRDAENQRGWARAMAEGLERTRRSLARGESVVYDTANHTRRNRDRCRRVAWQASAEFRCVWVDAPVEVARERLLANRADPERVDVPDASFRQIVDAFEPPSDEPDTVRYEPGMDMDELMRALDMPRPGIRHPK
ncbi:MAG TPA: ATP-binding protein [Thermomicrobiales bacterium]|nr:ATP-binding protein [Thermomicrobiales bacterium]